MTTSELTKLVAGRYQPLVTLPRRNDTALRCSESLSPGRALTTLEEALVVYGTVVLPLPQEAQRVLLPPAGAAASSGANLWDELLPYFAEDKWLKRTMRRFVEPERDRITISLGTLGDVLRTDGKSALAAKLMTVMSGVAKSAQEASHWGEERMNVYDQSVICTLPGQAVEGFRAYGLAPNGKAEEAAAPRRGTVELEAGSAQRRPAQDWHFDFEARAVAGSWQLALAHGRFLVPPSSLLAPLGGQGPKLIRQLHVAPYRTFPGNASEAKGTRCLRASFADAIGNMREPVAAVAQIPTGSLAWFLGAHAGDAMPAGAGAMLALFARVRSSGLAAEPNVQNLFRCHFEQDAYFEIPQQLPPQYGFAAHEPVQVPRFSADGLLRWASHSDRGAAWRPVRKTPPAHLPCTCLHSPLQHITCTCTCSETSTPLQHITCTCTCTCTCTHTEPVRGQAGSGREPPAEPAPVAPPSPRNPVLAAALADLGALEDAPAAAGVSAPSGGGEDEDERHRLLRQAISKLEAARQRREAVDSLHL